MTSAIDLTVILRSLARYRSAMALQQARFWSAWQDRRSEEALVELHFFVISVCTVYDAILIAGDAVGEPASKLVAAAKRDFAPYRETRNHFEHIDDRFFSSQINTSNPVTEDGSTRTVHFGLHAASQTFRFGDKAIDLGERALDRLRVIATGIEAAVETSMGQL